MSFLHVVLGVFALFGHFALWTALNNRVYSTHTPHKLLRTGRLVIMLVAVGVPLVYVYRLHALDVSFFDLRLHSLFSLPGCYLMACWCFGARTIVAWILLRSPNRSTPLLESNHTDIVDVQSVLPQKPAVSLMTRVLASVPGNETFELAVNVKTLRLPRLPLALDGLTILHLSDLHFKGHIAQSFFDQVVDQANRLDSDLVAITGDIIDRPGCIDWIPDTLGTLRHRFGAFYVKGNHEIRLRPNDIKRVDQVLGESGLIPIGGHWTQVEIHGYPVIIAGNALPWFSPAPEMTSCPARTTHEAPFRILLAHSPDQITWARTFNFDLMLAGHTHGGQICFPLIGPVVCPSLHGVKYASGTFYQAPTLMHVSRGVSSTAPYRINCRPEITKLVLRSGE